MRLLCTYAKFCADDDFAWMHFARLWEDHPKTARRWWHRRGVENRGGNVTASDLRRWSRDNNREILLPELMRYGLGNI